MSRQSNYGSSDLENPVVNIDCKVVNYTAADLVSGYFNVHIKGNTIVNSVAHLVTTAFSGATTGACAVTIGTGVSGAGADFLASAQIVPGTKNTFVSDPTKNKYFAADGVIQVTALGSDTGAGKMFIYTTDLNGTDRLAAL